MSSKDGANGIIVSHDEHMSDAPEYRSSSPALKRPAAEMGGDEQKETEDMMDTDSSSKALANGAQSDRPSRGVSVDMMGTNKAAMSNGTKNGASEEANSGTENCSPSEKTISLDEQVATVMKLVMQPPKDNQRGYIVSASWLNRVLARANKVPMRETQDKMSLDDEIGPVDNSDLVLVTDPSTLFKDEAGEPFVPLRPGLTMGEDFEIFPQEAWDLIMEWYGLLKNSPKIVRYAHNTTSGTAEHIQYELNPPIFTILKLPSPTSQNVSDKDQPPVKALATSHTVFQKWLADMKKLASIEPATKVRVWRIIGGLGGSGSATPIASRSVSPAPGSTLVANAGNSLVLDVNKFNALTEGSQRELIDFKDQTMNEKYNGKTTLHLAGLGADNVIVLEEQIGGAGGGEWASSTAKYGSNRLSALTAVSKGASKPNTKANTAPNSGRTSPAPATVTRGRKRKDGRTRGVTGLSNLGNTCYMNSALQCVRSVEELTQYFLSNEHVKDLNPSNPLSHNGEVAKAYASLLHQMFSETSPDSISPRSFKTTVGRYGPSFSGYGQQDSQEFVLFLLDGLQEDLNRIHKKPYIEKPDSTDDMVHDSSALQKFADRNWEIYKARNDSVITDLFAGMYKSTVVCPVCDKVSIIFDPFSNLTLQLPIENVWSKKIFYFPLRDKPVLIDVEIDKHASIKSLKELVAKKVNSDATRLVMAEIVGHKIYKLFSNSLCISDCGIADRDHLAIYELESVPTSYDPDHRPTTSYNFYSPREEEPKPVPFDSEKADRILVPIYNRSYKPLVMKGNPQRRSFGVPKYVVITREEAMDYDAIFRKILVQISTLTTLDILADEDDDTAMQSMSTEDSDAVIMNEDDIDSNDSKIKMGSVEGEADIVDVSMRDVTDTSSQDGGVKLPSAKTRKSIQPGAFIPPALQNLYTVKYIATQNPTGIIPNTLDATKEYPIMLNRMRSKKAKKRAQRVKAIPVSRSNNSPVSSDDELARPPLALPSLQQPKAKDPLTGYSSSEESKNSESDAESVIYPGVRHAKKKEKGYRQKKPIVPVKEPYIRPGEAILLDWNEGAYDALFNGDLKDTTSLRGVPTWENAEKLPDPELDRKRQLRQNKRKNGVTLNDCLDEFGREEILSENDAWYCPRCKEHRRASKRFELWTIPDILVMHLKRFSANRGFKDKLDILVDFPLELDMTGRAQAPDDGKSMMYDLIAVDNHYGNLGGGHYTAYAKSFIDGHWYDFNDSQARRKNDPNSVVSTAAYLLFYRRRSDHPLGGPFLARVSEAASRKNEADSDSQEDSDDNSGEGQRLDGFSRTGSSSASAVAAAAHQAGDGGLQDVLPRNDADLDELPSYVDSMREAEMETMEMDLYQAYPGPLGYSQGPSWSFARTGQSDDEDNLSTKAMGGDDSDLETQIQPLAGGDDEDELFPGINFADPDDVHILGTFDDDDDDGASLPVVELDIPDGGN